MARTRKSASSPLVSNDNPPPASKAGNLGWTAFFFVMAPVVMFGFRAVDGRRQMLTYGGITILLSGIFLLGLSRMPSSPTVQELKGAITAFFAFSFIGGYLCGSAYKVLDRFTGDGVIPQIVKAAAGGALIILAPGQIISVAAAEQQRAELAQAILPDFVAASAAAMEDSPQAFPRLLCVVDGLHGPVSRMISDRTPEQVGEGCREATLPSRATP